MKTIAVADETEEQGVFSLASLQSWSVRMFQGLLDLADQAMAVHRQQFILGSPTPQRKAEFTTAVRELLQHINTISTKVQEPYWTDRAFAARVQGTAIHLRYVLFSLENPMTDEEADKILAEAFPDEPRA